MSKSSQKREREKRTRERDRGRRFHDLCDHMRLACGMPPDEAIHICKTNVNDSILDDGEALETNTGVGDL